MKKVTIIIEEVSPKYVVPKFNHKDVFLSGIPCEVLSEPYDKNNILVIDVKSCVTGRKYAIPCFMYNEDKTYYEFETIEEANKNARISVDEYANLQGIIGRDYWVKDNSYISRLYDYKYAHCNLMDLCCKVVSEPYNSTTNYYGEVINDTFINVLYEKTIYKVPLREWSFYPRSREEKDGLRKFMFDGRCCGCYRRCCSGCYRR